MKSFIRLFFVLILMITILRFPAHAASSSLVINQIYLGTGAGRFEPQNQYLEIFNKGTTTVNVSTWSLQYAVEGTAAWQVFPLSGSIAQGQYYLIKLTGAAVGNVNLPQPDLTITLTLPQNVGKLLIAN